MAIKTAFASSCSLPSRRRLSRQAGRGPDAKRPGRSRPGRHSSGSSSVPDQLGRTEMAQLLEGAELDLTDALSRDVQARADLFERSRVAVVQAEAHLQHVSLARRQLVEHLVDLLAADEVEGRLGGRWRRVRLNEVRELA